MDRKLIIHCALTLCATAVYFLLKENVEKKSRRKRLCKTRIINRRRRKFGFFNMYFLRMKNDDPVQFFKYTRMSVKQFDFVLCGVTPMIRRQKAKDGISAEERLSLTLHYLSQGCSMQTIAWKYQMGLTTVHKIIKETCEAIYQFLHTSYLKSPNTAAEWLEIAESFNSNWNFPHCIGALDGKHIAIQAPAKSGSQYFNYKKYFSIVLLASCDANYIFRMVDIGAYGSNSDGGIFRESAFGQMLSQDLLNIPPPANIPGTNIMLPYVIVADEAFPLKSYIMRPYPGKKLTDKQLIFNYRLSRARRCIENAFGIMTNRWRLLRTTIIADVKNIDVFIKAIICLHNFLRSEQLILEDNSYCPQGFVGEGPDQNNSNWRNDIIPLPSVGRLSSNRASRQNMTMRDTLCDYFMSVEGSLPWQHKVITEGFN